MKCIYLFAPICAAAVHPLVFCSTAAIATSLYLQHAMFTYVSISTRTRLFFPANSVSGKAAEHPVISRKSGAIFERRLIEEYIAAHGKDPVSDEDLTNNDLTPIKTAPQIVPPQLPTSALIPSLLKTFQNEWDSLALEVFSLRKQLHTARQELSASLYHYDAAVRVAARATAERDEAQRALQELSQAVGNGTAQPERAPTNSETSETKSNTTLQDIAGHLEEERERLFSEHKAQKKALKPFSGANYKLEVTENDPLPFKSLAAAAYRNGKLALASTAGSITISDMDKGETTKIARKGKPSAMVFAGKDEPVVVMASKNKIFVGNQKTPLLHSGEIMALASHPTLPYFIAVGPTGWMLASSEGIIHLDLSGYSCAAFHIDGKLVALGSESSIDIVDISSGDKVASVDFSGATKLAFAPNGYWLLALTPECLLVIDIRSQTVTGSIDGAFTGFVIDETATTLVVTTETQMQVYQYLKSDKKWASEPSSSVPQGMSYIFTGTDESYSETGTIPVIGAFNEVIKGVLAIAE